jgi:hypothetical protein
MRADHSRLLAAFLVRNRPSKRAGPVDNDGDPFVHACYCGKWGFFGYDVMLMKGRTGRWFCAEHRPADEAGLEPLLRSPIPIRRLQ